MERLICSEVIQKDVEKIARQIEIEYSGRVPVLLGVLTGAFAFVKDLSFELNIDHEVDFIRASSYENTQSTGTVNLNGMKDFSTKDIILVEDIIDTGLTIKTIIQNL